MILDAATKIIEFFLDGAPAANQLPATVAFVDYTSTTLTPAPFDTISNSATAVTLVPAPGASTQRQVKSIHIFNADTAPRTVTVRYNNNGTLRQMIKAILAVGDSLVYEWGRGWFRVPNASTVESGFFGDGSAAAPSITFGSNPVNGLYRPALNQLGITVAGVQVAQIDAAQLGLAPGLVARMLSQNRFRHLNAMVLAQRITTGQSILDSTVTAINFNGEIFDTDSLHDTVTNNTRLTVSIPGGWFAFAVARWAGNATGTRFMAFRINGAGTLYFPHRANNNGAVEVQMPTSGLLSLVATDYVELVVSQNSGGALNIDENDTQFGMFYAGE